MPSVSPKQHRFMEWIDHTPGAARKAGVPKDVAHEYVQADKGKRIGKLARHVRKRR